MDELDPRFDSSQGSYVTYNSDFGGEFVPLSVSVPRGRYVTYNADFGAQYEEYTEAERAALAQQMFNDRKERIAQAASTVAANPLPISGDQIATYYGDRSIDSFRPIVESGIPITGSTPTQLIDPQSNMPVYLSNPNDQFSYTYDNTGTPAIGGTLEQQAAMFRPTEDRGVFGTIGRDFLEGVKDPYFKNFAIAAAAMAAAAALAPVAGGGASSAGAGGAVAEAFPVVLGDTITTGGLGAGVSGSTAGGFLGGAGDILAGAAGTGGGSLGGTGIIGSTAGGFLGGSGDILAGAAGTGGGTLGALGAIAPSASTLSSLFSKGAEALSGPFGSLIKGGLSLGGLAAASALKPKTDASSGTGMSVDELNAIVALMPSMVGQYTSGMGQPTGYNPNQAVPNLFPNFSLPTQGPFFGAGRFGDSYNPAPLTTLV